jgi:hypothetical protein
LPLWLFSVPLVPSLTSHLDFPSLLTHFLAGSPGSSNPAHIPSSETSTFLTSRRTKPKLLIMEFFICYPLDLCWWLWYSCWLGPFVPCGWICSAP